MRRQIIIVMANALLFTSCGITKKKASEKASKSDVDLFAEAIAGAWQTKCSKSTDGDEVSYTRTIFKFNEDQTLSGIYANYGDDQCKNETSYVELKGPYTIEQDVPEKANAGKARYVTAAYKNFYIKASSEELVQAFNEAQLCGVSDYKAGEAKEVPKSCIAEDLEMASIVDSKVGSVVVVDGSNMRVYRYSTSSDPDITMTKQ